MSRTAVNDGSCGRWRPYAWMLAFQMLGCSYAEAAGLCGCPVGTIRSRIARAREDLDAMVTGREGESRQSSASGAGN